MTSKLLVHSFSVIVPAVNEEGNLPRLLSCIAGSGAEVLVADGGSTDGTEAVAARFGARVLRSVQGRGAQMNAGAAASAGEWLWFLHADSIPPPDWKGQIEGALSDPAVVGGAFRSVIDAAGPAYRLLDLAGQVRFAVQRTLTGDQGIFVRRAIFEQLGGFADWPILEDLDFSYRLSRVGPLRLLRRSLKTSARRWQTFGWWPTVADHTRQALSYRPVTLGIMAKDPVPGQVKTRLVPPLTPEQAAELAARLLQEAVSLSAGLAGVRAVVAVAPSGGIPRVRGLLPRLVPLVAQGDGNLGDRLRIFFEQQFHQGARAVMALGADHPGLPVEYLRRAVALLRRSRDPVVLGPTEDGGYYLIGLNRPHQELFEGIPWGTSEVFRLTCDRARRLGLPVSVLPPWFDVDRPEDLARFAWHTAIG